MLDNPRGPMLELLLVANKTDDPEGHRMTKAEFYAKLDIFVKRLENERNAAPNETTQSVVKHARAAGRSGYHIIGYDDGKRFVRVWDNRGIRPQDTSRGVSYFVEKETGIIFGAKSWKIYNPNREYGTLDTIDEWDWSDFYGKSKTGKDSLVPQGQRR